MFNLRMVWPLASAILPGAPYKAACTITVAAEANSSMVKLINKLTLFTLRAAPTTTNKDRD